MFENSGGIMKTGEEKGKSFFRRPDRPQREATPPLPEDILQTSLILAEVAAPEFSEQCPGKISLSVGLEEGVLLEGLSAREADLLLRLAATLRRPAGGRIYHWGRDLFALTRRALYPWRRRLAFVSPFQSLLPRLTVLENVTLSQTLTTPQTAATVGQEHGELLEQLALVEYLSRFPPELPTRQYHLALWARELIKNPQLILGVLAGQEEPHGAPSLLPHLLPLFQDYRTQRRGAMLLAGPFLEPMHPVADRLLSCRGEFWREQSLPGRWDRPLLGYLNLL